MSHNLPAIRLILNNVPCGSRIALICAGGTADANRENHRTGISSDRAFSRPPVGVLCGGTPDLGTVADASRPSDARAAPDAVAASRRACVNPGAPFYAPLPDHRRITVSRETV